MLWPQGVMPKTTKPAHQPNYKKIQNYVFDLNDLLGAGNFSKVYKSVNQTTNQVSAIKVVELSSIKNKTLVDLLYSEIEVLKTLKHPNILNCIEVFSSNNNCYIITEFCNEGDLESRIRDWGALSEMQARKLIYQTFSGLKYLSDHQIIHRDLKVANIFLSNGTAKIADFGFVRKLKTPDQRFKDINIGSPIYMSPEGLLQNYYGPKTDVWAFGIFLYEILHGDTPLAFCQSESELHANLKIPLTKDRMLPNLSPQLKDLILRALEVDERKRISFQEMYNHPYILYLRKLYEKPIQTTPQNLIQTPKLKTSQSTYQTQQSKSQAETEAMINQYNKMTPQQRAASSVSIGSMSINGLSNLMISPQQQNIIQPQSPGLHPKIMNHQNIKPILNQVPQSPLLPPGNTLLPNVNSNVNFQNINNVQNIQPVINAPTITNTPTSTPIIPTPVTTTQVTTTQIQQTNASSSVVPTNIIKSTVAFPECVQVLHYCRLVYKCFNFGKSTKSCSKLNPYLSNWLLSLITEIQQKQTTHITFVGERAALRQQKLHQVITQYSAKYKSQLKWIPNGIVNVEMLDPLILQTFSTLDAEIKSCRNPTDLETLVKLAHYLYSLQEANLILKKSIETGDFSPIISAKIQDFLNKKQESFTLESYGGFRNKVVSS